MKEDWNRIGDAKSWRSTGRGLLQRGVAPGRRRYRPGGSGLEQEVALLAQPSRRGGQRLSHNVSTKVVQSSNSQACALRQCVQ